MTIVSLVKQAFTEFRRDAVNRAAARQLHGMTDAQLADMGIARDQIDAVVNGSRDAGQQPSQRPVNAPLFSRTVRL
ncbi:MAG: DUF1127 domain-containing protein [Pseudomonadota bacterium]